MTCQLTWTTRPETSALHCASVVSANQSSGELPQLERLSSAVVEADALMKTVGVPPGRLWNSACACSLTADGATDLAELVFRKLLGAKSRLNPQQLALVLRPILQWNEAAFPKLSNTLQTRKAPLKIQWEARGPGLLHFVAKLTNQAVIPPSAIIALVHPVAGGRGVAHLQFNSVRFEAMLANPMPQLPEVVRLAWLISQLQIDVPMNSETLNLHRLPWLGSLALLPATLSAAEFVELVHVDPHLLVEAIDKWIVPLFPEKEVSSEELMSTVWNWWKTYQESRPPWPVALAALDRLIP